MEKRRIALERDRVERSEAGPLAGERVRNESPVLPNSPLVLMPGHNNKAVSVRDAPVRSTAAMAANPDAPLTAEVVAGLVNLSWQNRMRKYCVRCNVRGVAAALGLPSPAGATRASPYMVLPPVETDAEESTAALRAEALRAIAEAYRTMGELLMAMDEHRSKANDGAADDGAGDGADGPYPALRRMVERELAFANDDARAPTSAQKKRARSRAAAGAGTPQKARPERKAGEATTVAMRLFEADEIALIRDLLADRAPARSAASQSAAQPLDERAAS